MIELFWEFRQDGRINAAEGAAARAGNRVAQMNERLSRAELQAEKAVLVMEAMWQLLRESAGVTDAQLQAKVRELDLADGKLDGKVSRPPAVCPDCKRTTSRRNRRCIYCGTDLGEGTFA
jgi:hypothetical protein